MATLVVVKKDRCKNINKPLLCQPLAAQKRLGVTAADRASALIAG
jgi:hypothetical protein